MTSAIKWAGVLVRCGVLESVAAKWAPLFEKHLQPEKFSAGPEDLAAFLGQVLHESGLLRRTEEDLRYSAQRLTAVWPNRFPSVAAATPYANNPEALANKVYGGRLGNLKPGDGWRYRGRGLIQVTGYDNYRLVQGITGIPILSSPDILATPEPALLVSKSWWEKRIPDSAIGDVERTTRIVNGGVHGLDDRKNLTWILKEALK